MTIDYSSYDRVYSLGWWQVLRSIKRLRSPDLLRSNKITEVSIYLLYFMIVTLFFLAMLEEARPQWEVYIYLFFAVLLLSSIVACSVYYRIYLARRQLAVEGFVRDNNLEYEQDIKIGKDKVLYPASIFAGGHHRILNDKISCDLFEIGNYQNSVGVQGYGGYINEWGYVAIKLKRKIPHLYMEPKKKKLFGNQLNIGFIRDQSLKLEGYFNDYFNLYCPIEYKRDAHYVLTPNLMILLVDNISNYHVEIVDDYCYVFGKKFNFGDRIKMEKIMEIIAELSPKIDRQTKNYADEFIGDKNKNIIDKRGRRLISIRADILVGVLALFVFLALRFEGSRNTIWNFFVDIFHIFT